MSELYKVGIKVWELSPSGELVARFDNTNEPATKGLQALNLVRHRGVHYDSVILGNQEFFSMSGADCLPKAVSRETVLSEISLTDSSLSKQPATSTPVCVNLELLPARSHGTLIKNMISNVEKDEKNMSLPMDMNTFDKSHHPQVSLERSMKDLTKVPSDTNLNGSMSGNSYNACPCATNESEIKSSLILPDDEPNFGGDSLPCTLSGVDIGTPESNNHNRSLVSVAELTNDRKECKLLNAIDLLPPWIEEPDGTSNSEIHVPSVIEEALIMD